jgi:hypothetical protein
MEERIKSLEKQLDEHTNAHDDAMTSIKDDIRESLNSYKVSSAERVEFIIDYIKRVEANKADRSEFNLVIQAIGRLEQKFDSYILNNKS